MDFVVRREGITEYYQVAASILDEQTREREIAALDSIPDHYPKYLLTLDPEYMPPDYNGIRWQNVLSWLLGTGR